MLDWSAEDACVDSLAAGLSAWAYAKVRGQGIFKISGQIVKSLQKHSSQIRPWKIFQMQQPPIAKGQNPHLNPSKCGVGYRVTPVTAPRPALARLTTLLAKTEPLTLHTVDSSKLRICSPFLKINALSLSCGSQKHPQPSSSPVTHFCTPKSRSLANALFVHHVMFLRVLERRVSRTSSWCHMFLLLKTNQWDMNMDQFA